MEQELWDSVDQYIGDLLAKEDAALSAAVKAGDAAGLPAIQVSPSQGKLLHILARAQGARAILEIGTLAGYSAIWLARALPPEGKLVTLEAMPDHAAVARANIARAGLADVVDLRVGRAQETLPRMIQEREGPFDLIFIDADKVGYPDYLEWSLELSRPGTLIVADNIVRDGAVADPANEDPNVRAVRRYNELLARNPRLTATVVQTVGVKGYDGFAIALVTD